MNAEGQADPERLIQRIADLMEDQIAPGVEDSNRKKQLLMAAGLLRNLRPKTMTSELAWDNNTLIDALNDLVSAAPDSWEDDFESKLPISLDEARDRNLKPHYEELFRLNRSLRRGVSRMIRELNHRRSRDQDMARDLREHLHSCLMERAREQEETIRSINWKAIFQGETES